MVQSPGSEGHTAGVLRGDTFVDLATLQERALRAATGLREIGVREGDTVALLMRNDHALFEAEMAAAALGAAPVPINWHGSAEEVAYVVGDSGSRVLVAHADLLARVRAAIPPDVALLGVTTPASIAEAFAVPAAHAALPPDVLEWSSWLEALAPLSDVRRSDVGPMIYTSGTTGHPKGVRRLPGTEIADDHTAYGVEVERSFGLWPGMRTVIAGPMYHSAPHAYAMLALRAQGAFIVLQDRFEPEGLLALVHEHRIDSLYMVPTMFVRLLRLAPEVRARYDLSSLRCVSHTAAPCPPDVKRALIEWLGPIVNEFYGSTEVGFVVSCNSEEWLAHPGTVGRALSNCEFQVHDESGVALAPGEVGEIFVRARSFSDFTYHGRDDARAEVERGGLITCGDVGFFDEDGFLYLCDRVRDMIISGGVNIYPIEIEACLLKMPGVADCAVFGIPDDEYGEAIAAAIKPDPGVTLDPEALRGHVRAHLAGYKVPKVITFHDELPREDSGKMFKRRLRAPYWEGSGRRI